MKNVIKLSVISEADARGHAILKVKNGSLVIRGNDVDGYTFECGGCAEVLAKDIFREQIRNIVFACNKCGRYNIIRFDWSVYILKYLREEVDYPVAIVGLISILLVSIYTDFGVGMKIFVNVLIFILSLFYKNFIQVFQEK